MNDKNKVDEIARLARLLENDLLKLYGPLLSGQSLYQALGYVSKDAFRQSIVRKTVPVPLFPLKHRRGKYALTKDVAVYLASQRFLAVLNINKGGDDVS